MSLSVAELKRKMLELLKEDVELRRAILEIVLPEVARRDELVKVLEEIRSLREEFNIMVKEIKNLREEFRRMLRVYEEGIKDLKLRVDSLCMRYGILTEEAFRSGIKELLEKHFNCKVERWIEYDDEGLVFGHPSVVEVDVVVRDDEVILIEITAHARKSDVATFKKKALLYEKKTGRKPTKLMIVTPYIDEKAVELAKALKVEVCSASDLLKL